MLDVQSALERAGIPGYRSAYRAGDDWAIPDPFVAWALESAPAFFMDDEPCGTRHKATLHLVSAGDPTAFARALCAAMAEEGYQLIDLQDSYDQDADVYVIISQWYGEQYVT